ncbi:MAG: serine/threonine-protein kinase [Myxococcota bacterium]
MQHRDDDFDGPSAASGLQIGNFKVLGHYATGGTSELWIALRDGAHEICLLKQLSIELSDHETAHRRFLREAQIAFRLSHKNIGRVLTAGIEGGRFCMSTEFIKGQNLTAMLTRLAVGDRPPMPLSIIHRIANDVLDGIGYLHDVKDEGGRPLDLVHRDLTPSNILVSFDGAVKIIDFGTARARIDDFKTAPGVVLGTPEYMSPEQALANPIDRRSDLYTFGIVLHELLTGRPVVPRGLSLLDALTIVRDRVPPPISLLRSDAPKSLDAVLERALQKNREMRYVNAAELKAAFTRGIGVPPASDETLRQYVNELLPEERARIETIVQKGQQIAEADAAYTDEESLAQAAYTRTAPSPLAAEPAQDSTAILGEPPQMGTAVTAVVSRSGGRRRRGGETPSVLEMPGTSVGKLSATHLLREQDALRREVHRLRVALLAVGASLVALAGLGIAWWLRSAPAPLPEVSTEVAPIRAPGAVAPVASQAPAPEIAAKERVEEQAAPVEHHAPPPTPRPEPSRAPASAAPATPKPERSAEATPPPPPPPPPHESPYARLDRALRDLQDHPRDSKLFDALEAEIRAAAASAPPNVRRIVEGDLAAAEKSLDPDPLIHAVKKLKSQ